MLGGSSLLINAEAMLRFLTSLTLLEDKGGILFRNLWTARGFHIRSEQTAKCMEVEEIGLLISYEWDFILQNRSLAIVLREGAFFLPPYQSGGRQEPPRNTDAI